MAIAATHGADLMAYYTSPTTTDSTAIKAEEIAEEIAAEFDAELHTKGLRGTWLLSDRPAAAHITSHIRYTDLAILGLDDPDGRRPNQQGFSVGEIVLSCGRPVLGVPVGPLPRELHTALIAFDGSREASRALHDALPLLRKAAVVTIVSIGDHAAMAERAAAHLAKHGVTAGIDDAHAYYDDIGTELLDRTASLSADLVVAGAYGHSRLGERLFGGASNTLLHQMLVPVLLSH
jgi:nucleotide-binding universal stress UspA family protein